MPLQVAGPCIKKERVWCEPDCSEHIPTGGPCRPMCWCCECCGRQRWWMGSAVPNVYPIPGKYGWVGTDSRLARGEDRWHGKLAMREEIVSQISYEITIGFAILTMEKSHGIFRRSLVQFMGQLCGLRVGFDAQQILVRYRSTLNFRANPDSAVNGVFSSCGHASWAPPLAGCTGRSQIFHSPTYIHHQRTHTRVNQNRKIDSVESSRHPTL